MGQRKLPLLLGTGERGALLGNEARSCLLYSIFSIANIASLASLKCGSSFCFGEAAVKYPNRLAIPTMLMWSGLTIQATSKSTRNQTASRHGYSTENDGNGMKILALTVVIAVLVAASAALVSNEPRAVPACVSGPSINTGASSI
jgi:hypothetical protein